MRVSQQLDEQVLVVGLNALNGRDWGRGSTMTSSGRFRAAERTTGRPISTAFSK